MTRIDRLTRRQLFLGGGAAVLVGALAGCTPGKSVKVGSGSTASASTTALKAAIAGEPDQLDPQKTTSYFSFEVLENVFDTLVEPDAALEMKPSLAKSWKTSADGLTWTFALRDGVTWHDGTAFTAADVVYSYERIINSKLSNAYRFSAVSGIKAPDDKTVVITLTQPSANLLSNIGGFKGVAIVQKANVESGAISLKPVGTGPYKLTSWTSGDSIVLSANRAYWGGAPHTPQVVFTFVSAGATAIASLKSGEIDWTDSIPPQQVSSLKHDSSVVLKTPPSSDYWYLALNEKRQPWNDVRARQAIAYAIDRAAIVRAAKSGNAAANELAIPKQSVWYASYDNYTKDTAKAKQLLAEAGVTGKLSIDMLATSDYPETVAVAQLLADELSVLGISVNIRTSDFSTWLDRQNSGDFDLLMMGWLGNIDPADYYYAQQHSKGASNAQGFSDPTVDKLLDAGQVETDLTKRKADYAQAAKIIADQASYIYLYNPSVVQAWRPGVTGYQARTDRAIRFANVRVSS